MTFAVAFSSSFERAAAQPGDGATNERSADEPTPVATVPLVSAKPLLAAPSSLVGPAALHFANVALNPARPGPDTGTTRYGLWMAITELSAITLGLATEQPTLTVMAYFLSSPAFHLARRHRDKMIMSVTLRLGLLVPGMLVFNTAGSCGTTVEQELECMPGRLLAAVIVTLVGAGAAMTLDYLVLARDRRAAEARRSARHSARRPAAISHMAVAPTVAPTPHGGLLVGVTGAF